MPFKNYSVSVETDIITSDDGQNTFEVTKRLNGIDGENGVIVLLYPTRNCDNIFSEDNTLNYLVSHMQELHLKELKIINLFSKVVSGKMSSRGLEVDEENMKYIETLMSDKNFKSTKFIVAWGNSMASSYACKKSKVNVLNMFKNAVPKGIVYQLISSDVDLRSQTAPHPLYLGIRGNNSKWSLAELHITKEMLKEPEKYNPSNNLIKFSKEG